MHCAGLVGTFEIQSDENLEFNWHGNFSTTRNYEIRHNPVNPGENRSKNSSMAHTILVNFHFQTLKNRTVIPRLSTEMTESHGYRSYLLPRYFS